MKVAFGTVREDSWALDQAGTQDLLEAMAECDRGEVVSESEVLASLARRR